MKTTMTAIALVLALGTAANAQDVKSSTAPATAPAATAPAAKPASTPDMMKVGASTTPVAPATAPKTEAKPAVAPATVAAPTKTAAPAAAKLVDINTVSAADLAKLPKVGEAGAKQIVAGRPYKSVDELASKKVLTPDAFNAVKGLISVK